MKGKHGTLKRIKNFMHLPLFTAKQGNYKTFDFLIILLPHILTLMFQRVLDEIVLIEANSNCGYYL